MGKNLFAIVLILILGLIAWIALGAPGSEQPASTKKTEKQVLAAAPIVSTETPTVEPSPTIGYQATANAAQAAASTAQANADAANRLLVAATAQHEANLQEQARWTAEANRQQLMFLVWTATAQPTSFVATETQRVVEQTKQAVIVTQLAMTIQAPTQIVMMAQAQSQAQMTPIYNWVYAIGLLAISIFLVALSACILFLVRRPVVMKEEKKPEDHFGTVVSIKTKAAGYTSMKRMVIPCTPAMLTELAKGLILEGKTLAINQWEGSGTHWTRDSFLPMRNFLLANQLALSVGQGMLKLTPEGESFLCAWLDEESVPPPYEFDPKVKPATGDMAHMSEAHAAIQPVGEGIDRGEWKLLGGEKA